MTIQMTKKEQELVDKIIFSPFAKSILEKDRHEIEKSKIRFNDRYYH